MVRLGSLAPGFQPGVEEVEEVEEVESRNSLREERGRILWMPAKDRGSVRNSAGRPASLNVHSFRVPKSSTSFVAGLMTRITSGISNPHRYRKLLFCTK